MNFDRTAEKYGLTPVKLAIVCVLGIVLAAVVYRNFVRGSSGGGSAASAGPAETAAGAPAEGRSTSPRTTGGQSDRPAATEAPPPKRWPEFTLAEAMARDPFAVPQEFPRSLLPVPVAEAAADVSSAVPLQGEAPDAERAAALAALQQQGVRLVMQNGQEYVAQIGGRKVRVGDRIDGFRVVDISFRGVILEGDASP